MIEKIRKFEKVIEENKSGFFQMIILYNMRCHENYKKLTDEQKDKLLGFLYTVYMKDESDTDLSKFSDIMMDNYADVLSGNIDRYSIYNYL